MKIEKKSVSISNLYHFTSLAKAYYESDKLIEPFYKYSINLDGFRKALVDKQHDKCDRNLLVEVLLNQYKAINLENDADFQAHTINQINLLKHQNTYTVTTGHQLCLSTGPLYVILKIVSTINLAHKLQQEFPSNKIIPVFWLASEDHDFQEINHFNVFGKTIRWEEKFGGPVGRISLESIEQVINQLLAIIGESKHSEEITDLIRKSYLGNQNLADATRFFIHKLFAQKGLIIIDPDDKLLKKQFLNVFKSDIFENKTFEMVNKTIEKLHKITSINAIKIQVNPRKINCFYMQNDFRERIEWNQEYQKFVILNKELTFTKDQLLEHLNEYPERFSPNVLLRPLYQESILPNLAYVGGAAEIAYWLELKDLFDMHKINFPVLIPRNSILWVDKLSSKKIEKLGLTFDDVFLSTEQLKKKYLEQFLEINLQNELIKLNELFLGIYEKTKNIDQSLISTVMAEAKKQEHALVNLERKLVKAEKNKFDQQLIQIENLKQKLFPKDSLQERYENFISFYLRFGNDFFDVLYDNLNPFDNSFIIFREYD